MIDRSNNTNPILNGDSYSNKIMNAFSFVFQALFAVENFMDDLACKLDMDVTKLREINLYNDGDRTYYTQKLENCTIRKCWEECKIMSDYENQKREVEDWNSKNKWKKRGIIMLPTKYGISFTSTMKNQGGALVHVSKP